MEARQEPTYSANLPASLDGDGEDAIALASAFFGEPMPWQRLVLKVMLSRDEHDKYAASVFALSVPRQNGKSWDVRARCFYGLVCSGEKILFTCQHGDTADEMFKDLSAVFEDEDNVELHALLKAVRKTNGQQAIYLNNGGYIRFTTRTNSLARGKTYDVLIYDEAQELTVAQQAASLPTISAGTLGNPQTIYLGTPPDPECAGTVFRTMHDRVHAGTSTVSWMEWGAAEVGEPREQRRWYETNPSLGLRLNVSAVEDESNSMPPESFARERLGWWDSATTAADCPIDSAAWDSTSTTDAAPDGVTVFAVKLAADGSTGCLSVAVRPDEGLPHVEAIRHFDASKGLTWLVEWLGRRQDDAALMVIDGTGAATALIDRLKDEQDVPAWQIERPNTADAIAAYARIAADVDEGRMRHYKQDALDGAAKGCIRRRIGSMGGWGFESTDDNDACIIESAALAYWGAMTTDKDQRGELLLAW